MRMIEFFAPFILLLTFSDVNASSERNVSHGFWATDYINHGRENSQYVAKVQEDYLNVLSDEGRVIRYPRKRMNKESYQEIFKKLEKLRKEIDIIRMHDFSS